MRCSWALAPLVLLASAVAAQAGTPAVSVETLTPSVTFPSHSTVTYRVTMRSPTHESFSLGFELPSFAEGGETVAQGSMWEFEGAVTGWSVHTIASRTSCTYQGGPGGHGYSSGS